MNPPSGPDSGPGVRRRGRRWAWRLLAYTSLALGLLLVGGLLGHRLTPPTTVAGSTVDLSELELESATAAPEVTSPAYYMPDLQGLDEDVARRSLADAGVLADPEVSEQPAAGPAGLVVHQEPGPGLEVGTQVRLVFSAPLDMPDLIGSDQGDASAILAEAEAAVQVERRVAPAEEAGLVLETRPAAGEPVPQQVVLVVSEPGEALFLTELSSVEQVGRCQRHQRASTVDGILVEDSLRCEPRAEGPAGLSYNIARRGAALRTVVGLDDSGRQGSAQVRILLDGEVLDEFTIESGMAQEVLVDIAGGLRLTVETTSTQEDSVQVIFGDAALLGDPGDLDVLRSL